MPRTVSLVVVDRSGVPLGALPPFQVDIPYWQEVADVVTQAELRYGVAVTVLRVLPADPPAPTSVGGAVSYLVEADHLPDRYRSPVPVDLGPHPLRHPYAEPGGPAASVDWATAALGELDRGPITAARQLRTWNLSTIWRLETPAGPRTPAGTVWLKQVPAFFDHEPAVLRWVAANGPVGLVPRLLAAGPPGRMLLDHVPGDDLYGAGLLVRQRIAGAFHPVQVASADAEGELLAAGVPDGRFGPLLARVTAVVARSGGADDPRLRALVAGLPGRLAEVEACGLPDALVHGDLHPGNARGPADPGADQTPVVLDWGDSFVGHPAFDILRLADGLDRATELVDAWVARWQASRPGSDPRRAYQLLRPVAALRGAVVYANFLDRIEPAEHPYHARDVPECLALAADLAGNES